MNLEEIRKLLNAEVLTSDIDFGMEVLSAESSDLMSDVLSFCGSGSLLITGLTNSQAVRIAEVVDLCDREKLEGLKQKFVD